MEFEEPAIACKRIRTLPEITAAIVPEHNFVITSRGCVAGEYFLVTSPGSGAPQRLNLGTSIKLSGRDQRIVLLVHGYRTLERPAAEQYQSVARTFRERKFPGVLIAYDWPSVAGFWEQSASAFALFFSPEETSGIGPAGRWEIRGYVLDRSNARDIGGPTLAKVISDLASLQPNARIDVVCFSMGCYVLQKALEQSGGTIPANVRHLVFLAADIDNETFPEIIRPSRGDQRVAVHYSREDSVLSVLSGTMNIGKPRLGAVGPPLPVPKHVSVSDETVVLGANVQGNTTPVHSRYLDTSYPVVTRVADFLAGDVKP